MGDRLLAGHVDDGRSTGVWSETRVSGWFFFVSVFFLRAVFIVLQTTVTVYPPQPNYSPPDYKLSSQFTTSVTGPV
jgi:hypothetical protein